MYLLNASQRGLLNLGTLAFHSDSLHSIIDHVIVSISFLNVSNAIARCVYSSDLHLDMSLRDFKQQIVIAQKHLIEHLAVSVKLNRLPIFQCT